MTSIIENKLLRELIGIARLHAGALAVCRQSPSMKRELAETRRIIAEAAACLPERDAGG